MEKLIKKAHSIYYFPSNQAIIYDKKGEQIPELQKEFQPFKHNLELLLKVAENCENHVIAKVSIFHMNGDAMKLTKNEFINILHLKK